MSVCVSLLNELCSQKYSSSVQVVHSSTVYQFVNLYIYGAMSVCMLCPIYMSKNGTWSFPVSRKEIWDYFSMD